LVDATEVGVYHCVQLAVRRAWLRWQDPVTGKNFDHRKVWIQERLAFLAGQFAIDICSMAIMSNHSPRGQKPAGHRGPVERRGRGTPLVESVPRAQDRGRQTG
jgi:hypothetical protein